MSKRRRVWLGIPTGYVNMFGRPSTNIAKKVWTHLSKSTVHRVLKARDLITRTATTVIKAAYEFKDKKGMAP